MKNKNVFVITGAAGFIGKSFYNFLDNKLYDFVSIKINI